MLQKPSRALHLVVLVAVLLAGCDSGGAPGPGAAETQFDLTGYWSLDEPLDCEISNLEGLPETLLALLAAALDSPEFPAGETGSGLQPDGPEAALEGPLETLFALLAAVLESSEFPADPTSGSVDRDDLESDLFAATSNEFHLEQMGNDLVAAFESADGSVARWHGTLMGDQLHFSQSEEEDLETFRVTLHTEITGTVLDADRMELTDQSDWTLQIPGSEPITGEVSCTHHATREG